MLAKFLCKQFYYIYKNFQLKYIYLLLKCCTHLQQGLNFFLLDLTRKLILSSQNRYNEIPPWIIAQRSLILKHQKVKNEGKSPDASTENIENCQSMDL